MNGKDLEDYFEMDTLKYIVRQPLMETAASGKFDVVADVHGGGIWVRPEQSDTDWRALVEADETYKPALRSAGFLTRDSRVKERKKYGLKSSGKLLSSRNVNPKPFQAKA